MNSLNRLERWRNESESRRERRAFLLAGSLTICLFVFWLASFRLSASFREPPTINPNPVSLIANVADEPGIITRIKAGWQATFHAQ